MELILFTFLTTLFVYVSYFLTESCDDEKKDKKTLKLYSTLSSIIIAVIVSIYFQELTLAITILLFYGISKFIEASKRLKKRKEYLIRTLFFIVVIICASIQPLTLLPICIYEFFRTTYQKFNWKNELLFYVLFSFSLALLFFAL